MWQARLAAQVLIGLSGIAVLGFGIKTISPGYIILGLLIVFGSVPLLARRRWFSFHNPKAVFPIYRDPQSPWQRGSNENTNGLLRQYLPKKADLSCHSQAELDAIALRLNQRPRKTLGFQTPADRLQASVASTPWDHPDFR
jgi:hypothetical protein